MAKKTAAASPKAKDGDEALVVCELATAATLVSTGADATELTPFAPSLRREELLCDPSATPG